MQRTGATGDRGKGPMSMLVGSTEQWTEVELGILTPTTIVTLCTNDTAITMKAKTTETIKMCLVILMPWN